MVDTFLLNEEDGDVLGLAGGIVKAIVVGPEQSPVSRFIMEKC